MGFPLAYLLFDNPTTTRRLIPLVVVALCVAPWRLPRSVERCYAGLAAARWLCIPLVFIVSFLATAALSLNRGIPLPYTHDEFSYLLAADTFAHGRITNPPHPMADHFESMHIIVRPTYMSKYPPGQGLFMALGQTLTGHPIVGVWLATATASAALCWMLMGFVPPRWALFGGLIAAMHPQILEWGQRYWGGNVAVIGGALLVGGVVRIIRRGGVFPPACDDHGATVALSGLESSGDFNQGLAPLAIDRRPVGAEAAAAGSGVRERPHPNPLPEGEGEMRLGGSLALPATIASVGIVILANSRPYEGFVFATLFLIGLLLHIIRRRAYTILPRLLLPALAILLPGAVLMGYYNWRITGNPLRLPYVEHQSQYGLYPLFIFQQASPRPVYNHKEMEIFHDREQGYWYKRHGDWYEIRKEIIKNLGRLREGAFGNVSILALPLLILPWVAWKNRRMRLLLAALLLFITALMLETYMFAHYAAPAFGAVLAIIVMCLHRASRLPRPFRFAGQAAARVTVGVFVLWSAFFWKDFYSWKQDGFALARHTVASNLANHPGKHLVLVRYGEHNVHEEWVYNAADIDASKVVWARWMDESQNRRLMEYYKNRIVWLMEPDTDMPAPRLLRGASQP